MKTIYYFLILFALCSVFLLIGCSKKQQTRAIVYVPDLTESYFIRLSVSEFTKISAIPYDHFLVKDNLALERIRIVPITELSLNPVFETEVKESKSQLSRWKNIRSYWQDIEVNLKGLEYKDRPGSVIYQTFARELNLLSTAKEEKRILITTTDFLEESNLGNFYHDETFQNVQTVLSSFEKKYPIDNLQGITILFLYRPSSKIDDQRYQTLSSLYQSLFERKGAKVIITSTLTSNSMKE